MKLNNSPQLKPDEKTESGHRKQDAQDGGFGWVVVFGSFFINFIAAGTLYSFGIIYTHFLDEFKESKAYTSWILSLLSGLSAVFGPITSFFVISYGCRVVGIAGAVLCAVSFFASAFAKNVFTLIVTIGIFGGFSLSLIFIPPLICVTTYFEKRRALATGIAVSGSGAGTFLIAPLISLLTNEYGWRITLMILSGKMLTCALFAALFRPINSSSQDNSSPEGSDISQRKQSEQFDFQHNDHMVQKENSNSKSNAMNILNIFIRIMEPDLFKDPIFLLFCLSSFFMCLGYFVPYFCIADKALTLDIPKENVGHFVAAIGIANTLGRVILGYISDRPFINRLWVYNICLIICGIANVLSFLCFDYITLMIYSVTFGFTCASFIALNSVILAEFFGLEQLESAIGIVFLFRGISTFFGSPIVGYLYDRTHSYTPGFLFAGIMISLSGATLFIIPPLQRCVMRRQLQHKNDHMESNGAQLSHF